MEFNNSDWDCGNALMYIFFSDIDRVSSEVEYSEILKSQLLYVLSNPDEYNGHEPLGVDDLNLIKRLINSIRLLPIKINGESQLAPIVWVKLALQISFTGTPIAIKFMKKYREWRDECQHSRKLALVVQEKSDVESKMKPSTKSRNSIAYSLDVFLLTDIAEFNPNMYNYSIQYKIVRTKETRPKKSDRNQIGENICREVYQCIDEVAKSNLGRFRFHEDQYGNLVYSGTRNELLSKLREKFGERLKGRGSDNVYLRAISLFVACKRCKRKDQHPKTKGLKVKRLF